MKNDDALENERLFGGDIDHFLNWHRTRILLRICRTAGIQEVNDNDIWESIGPFLTNKEMQAILDAFVPKRKQAEFIEENSGFHLFTGGRAAQLEALHHELDRRKALWAMLGEILQARVNEYDRVLQSEDFQPRSIQCRFSELQKYLDLNEHELDILMVFFLQNSQRIKLGDFAVNTYCNTFDIHQLTIVTGISEYDIITYLADNANLRKYGLIDEEGDIERGIMSFLNGTSTQALSERFWTKCTEVPLPWEYHGKIAEEHGETICDMIRSKTPENGCSILLYGAAGAGKTSFAISLAAHLDRDLYFIAQSDKNSCQHSYSASFRYTALAAAQRQLDPDKCILVVDECDSMIEACHNNEWTDLDKPLEDGAETKGQLNTVIDENRHTIIWICNSQQDAIAKSSRRRFDYSVLFDELLPETRVRIWENSLKRFGCEGRLDREFIEKVSRIYKVNAGGIALAVKNTASLLAAYPDSIFEDTIMKFLRAHCTLLGIRRSDEERLEPSRDYSLKGLNIHSGISLERLIQVCSNYLRTQDSSAHAGRDCPRMNLLLHGVPGSGKTEFAKFLAKKLGMKLNIKNASELLSKYVGGTEHLVAAAFEEAEKNNEIFFLDEGDSMLASRSDAYQSWEVSQVNTWLAEMEHFKGIFIVSTNLIQKLDPAALRRFTFRIHFDFLENPGKDIFYDTYFKHLALPLMTDAERDALHDITQLTPADFRNVRQQFFYLDSDAHMTHAEIIKALKLEAESHCLQREYKGLGEERHGIGFGVQS